MFGLTKISISLMIAGLFAAAPTSLNFTLKSYDFGNGGDTSTSLNYGLNSETGEQSGSQLTSLSYKINSGNQNLQNANVPVAPTFTNPSSEYNRLKIIINTSSNPTDTKYEIAISSDSFSTTNYVQTDNTVGATSSVAQFQTYTSWGGASGVWIVGLSENTSYQVKVRALQGNYTGTAFGPTASASTVLPSLTFSVQTSLSASPPYSIGFSGLAAGVVSSGSATAEIGLTTNSNNGGLVYVKSTGALTSALASTSITSVSADLSVASSGYGAIVTSVSQSSGGPISSVAPFSGVSNNVGGLTTAFQKILTTSASLTAGVASVTLKAKVDSITPSSTDYSDSLTFVASMLY
ncbi:MAG: hypothetical protein WCJ60_03595 [bacterium]